MRKEGVSGEKMERSGDYGSHSKAILQLGRQDEILEILSEGFCSRCKGLLQSRLEHLSNGGKIDMLSSSNGNYSENFADFHRPRKMSRSSRKNFHLHENSNSDFLPALANKRQNSVDESKESVDDEFVEMSRVISKDFVFIERIDGRLVDILKGLELHTRVFNELEQKKIVDYVYKLQRLGQEGQLRARTYSEPKKWMRGKGRVTIQFGCCYNYALDKKGNLPGILRDEEVDPLPPLFKTMIKRLVRWNVLPSTCIPDSCIVNIYDAGDCIPPHIDHHDFLRPFCTVSLLSECNILFGSNLKIMDAGEFSGPIAIPLPVGSVLVLNGNGSDVAKHCVPSVPAKRISITFRKMDDSKLPFRFRPDPELQGLQPLLHSPQTKYSAQQIPHSKFILQEKQASSTAGSSFHLGERDLPHYGRSNSSSRSRPNKRRFID